MLTKCALLSCCKQWKHGTPDPITPLFENLTTIKSICIGLLLFRNTSYLSFTNASISACVDIGIQLYTYLGEFSPMIILFFPFQLELTEKNKRIFQYQPFSTTSDAASTIPIRCDTFLNIMIILLYIFN